MTNLTQHLASVAAKEAGDQNIWIDCSGRFLITANNLVELLQSVAFFREADDKEALEGRVSYSPASRAIPLTYFPYLVSMKREAKNDIMSLSKTVDLTQPSNLISFSIRARGTKWTSTLDTTHHW